MFLFYFIAVLKGFFIAFLKFRFYGSRAMCMSLTSGR